MEVPAIATFPKNILLADTNHQRSQHTAHLLNRLEYNVFMATTAPDLFMVTRAILPNLILLDVRMPFYENADCLLKIRQDKLLDIIKVVTVGELTDDKMLLETLGKGAQGAIRRPMNPTELYTTIHNLIEPNPRQSLRLRVIFKVDVMHNNALKPYFATVLSDQGMFIRTTTPLPVGDAVKVRIELPSIGSVELSGAVIYQAKHSHNDFQESGMGIRFLNIDKDVQRNIRKFVENCLTGEFEENVPA